MSFINQEKNLTINSQNIFTNVKVSNLIFIIITMLRFYDKVFKLRNFKLQTSYTKFHNDIIDLTTTTRWQDYKNVN